MRAGAGGGGAWLAHNIVLMSVLTAELKAQIQSAYSAWLQARGFRTRLGQREMIAEIARTCAGDAPRQLALEAGTGTGKTVAYCLATIPIAQALDKTVVIASATVALQEQINNRDLPDLQHSSGLDFTFALAKGRGRYLCLKRLDQALKPEAQESLTFLEKPAIDYSRLYQRMLGAYAAGDWDGEVDSWSEGVEDAAWRALTMDHRGCAHRKCAFFQQCPFFQARGALHDVDVIVANQDLLLVDYGLGDGTVLPNPDDAIVIVDEAHHLPDKTQRHFTARVPMRGALNWTDQIGAVMGGLLQQLERPKELERLAAGLASDCDALKEALAAVQMALGALPFAHKDAETEICRFNFGRVDEAAVRVCADAAAPLREICARLAEANELLRKALEGDLDWSAAALAEEWLPTLGGLQDRAEATMLLFNDYAQAGDEAVAGQQRARWIKRTEKDLEAVSAPIEPGALLEAHLWSRCYAGVLTSATLTSLGRFDRCLERAGLPAARAVRILSPFDYPNIAVLSVPRLRADPRDFAAHTAEVAALLPDLLAKEVSALVLCTSWRQLRALREALPEQLVGEALQAQGERAKQAMLDAHRARVDLGRPGYLMGLASFAEGLDLPGDYCRHVIIVKLPFAVPDDPLDQAIAELAEAQGRNAFTEITVPDAALRLVQACGRLIRSENDHGRISLLDKRVLTKGYGRALLDSLPPFRRELGG